MKHKQFKPFERVIINVGYAWDCELYSYYDDKTHYHMTLGHSIEDDKILPYEGNEHLVGRIGCNINNEPKITYERKRPKVWSDMETLYEDIDTAFVDLEESLYNIDCERKLIDKTLATFQIRYLIELGYGGVVTEEEWQDDTIKKWYVIIDNGCIRVWDTVRDNKKFIAFHTQQQLEEFMSYHQNRTLVEQYYMI